MNNLGTKVITSCFNNAPLFGRCLICQLSSLAPEYQLKSISNEDIKPAKTFINRNPRNLERLALGHKDIGWGYAGGNPTAQDHPRRNYYHRIRLERTCSYSYATLEHYFGHEIIKVSTRDWMIRKHLYKANDVTACAVLGGILVELCIRAGISCAEWVPHNESNSEATKVFLDAITSTGFSLEEPEEIRFADLNIYRDKKGPLPPNIV